jgi:hypothetical protein
VYFPAAQSEHAEIDVAPVEPNQVPAKHATQAEAPVAAW